MSDTVLTPDSLAELRGWEGRSETLRDEVTAAPVRNLSATLDRDDPLPQHGTELPPLWHWLYFLPGHRQSEIGPDGHPRRGGFLPPVPLPRRMWAGGRLTWYAPLRVGEAIERTSRIVSVTHKSGRSGDLVFVLVRHEVRNAQGRMPLQPATGPHAARQRHRRQEAAALRMAVRTEFALARTRQEVQPVPQRRQFGAGLRRRIVAIQRGR